jgi:nucleoside-diphosphate-sugar epimerase
MRIAVTGGTGFIGSHVVEALLADGHEVSCLVLPGEGPGWIEGLDVRFSEGSVLDAATLGPFLEGADAIVHLAGLTRAKTEAEFMAVNADGAANVIEAALALSPAPRHIVAMSSLAAVGPSAPDGIPLDEGAPRRPISPYGRSKAALEDVVAAYRGRIEYTFIRAPGVYGPRDKDFLQYFQLVKRGLRLIIGPRNVLSILYVKTLARAIASCVLNPAAYGHAFFIADEGAYDWDQFADMIERALGKRTLRVKVPGPVVSVVAFFSWLAKPFMRKPPLVTANKILEMRQPCWIVSTAKAERLLGFKPIMTADAAIAETAAWYEARKWI